VAANRLMEALNNNGVKAKMLVRDKETNSITVVGLPQGTATRWHFLWERWCIFRHLRFSRRHLFEVDIANTGSDITKLQEFREADVIHLNWINQGMLSLSGVGKILDSGKPVVWTMHDLWPATGICHYARTCQAFRTGCRNCPLLPGGGSANDLSARIWRRKQELYRRGSIFFVACSKWLCDQAKHSALFVGQRVESVPNAIDTRVFCRKDRHEARLQAGLPAERRIILFVSQRVTDERKGSSYFIDAIDKLVEQHPEMKADTGVAILGGHSEEIASRLALPAYALGYVNDEKRIVSVYNAANVFVLPSLEDNLPNTIMEAMACGVPCVGFNVGGIPEEIDHRLNGYIAEYKNSADLAQGIHWVLDEADGASLSRAAVNKVLKNYSQRNVALRYIDIYHRAMALKNYRL
jgi:glycosyltransferase involved in cell wall biosynthesis